MFIAQDGHRRVPEHTANVPFRKVVSHGPFLGRNTLYRIKRSNNGTEIVQRTLRQIFTVMGLFWTKLRFSTIELRVQGPPSDHGPVPVVPFGPVEIHSFQALLYSVQS